MNKTPIIILMALSGIGFILLGWNEGTILQWKIFGIVGFISFIIQSIINEFAFGEVTE